MKWPRVPWGKLGKSFLLGFLLVLLFFSVGLWYLTTNSFQQMARGRLIAEMERATGGRVEIQSFHTVPLRLQVEISGLTIHGKEAAGEQPYAHVDRMSAVVSLPSALGAKLGFHSLILQHPIIHIIFYPDGSTNQPTPARQSSSSDLERLFSLSARHLEIRQGELLWQDQRIPLDFSSNDVSADMNYSFLHLRYLGSVAIGNAETQFDDWRTVAWAARSDFSLDRNGLQIQSLNATAGNSRLDARDLHFNFPSLTAQGRYDLNLDLGQIASITRNPEIKAGTLQLVGTGQWSQKTFASVGSFRVTSLGFSEKAFSGRDLSAEGQFSIDPQAISLAKVQGQFLNGIYAGEAELVNWQAPPKSPRGREQQGTIRLKTKNLALSELLAGLGTGFRPENKLKFAGNVSGTVDVRWTQSIGYAQAKVSADVAAPARKQSGEIPMTGSANAAYDFRSGNLQIDQFSASTYATQIRASGSLSNVVKLSFSSTDLNEWRPVISQLFPEGMPVVVNGRAAFNGTASGKSSALKLAGNLQLQNFDVAVRSSSKAPTTPVHWDALNAEVQASPSGVAFHNAVLRREEEKVILNGSVGLSAWNVASTSPLHLHIDMLDANADEIANIAGYDHEISGKLSGQFQISGTPQNPQGQASFSLVNARIRGQVFDSVDASVALSGTQVTIKDLRLARGEARIEGGGTYDLASKSFQLNGHGTNFDFAEVVPVENSQIKISGKLDFAAKASGTVAQPEVAADLRLRNLVLNDQPEGDFSLNAVSRGADVTVTGRSEFRDAELQINGNVHLRNQWPTHIDFHFSHLNADPFIESYLHNKTVQHSTIAGDLTLDGPLRSSQQLNLVGNLSDLYAEAGKTSFRNDGPIRFTLSDREFKVDNFRVLGENTDFTGGGRMQLAGERAVDFQGKGKVDLKLIETYDPDITSSGNIVGEGRITGTLDAPLVKGTLQIENGAISDINVPSALSEINGALLFTQNQVTIESLNAHVGGGTVGFTGRAELSGKRLNFDLKANADAVRLRYPPGVSSTANAQLTWSGSSAGSTLAGDITITKLAFTPGFDFGAYLERTAQVSSLPQTDPVLNRIRMDLHVVTNPELQMQTSVIRLQGAADLRVRGSAAKPILLGRADVFEGQAYFNGTKYRLERGGVTFSNPAVTTPFLDLEAVTRVRDYDITLSLSGDVSKPNGLKVNYRSDPPLPSADIIALLAFGQTTEESAQLQQSSQSAFSQQASSAMLAAALNATLNNRAQHLFGNSRIKIDPQGLESETSTVTQSGPAVTIEQQVKDNLTLSYTTDVSQTSQQVIRAEYNVSKNVSIVAIRDQNGVVSFDVKIRRRRR
ncbi:MAG TPA: translocation/assembly module TamB domain-containing protein [Terriglobales bacterium]|nr:translocation/assembly module TamB domain-containing protein [Terriglobales bacterium]